MISNMAVKFTEFVIIFKNYLLLFVTASYLDKMGLTK